MFISEVILATKIMNEAVQILKSHLCKDSAGAYKTVVIGTVKGLHDIGNNLVSIMMESHGLKAIDLGTVVDPEDLLAQLVNITLI